MEPHLFKPTGKAVCSMPCCLTFVCSLQARLLIARAVCSLQGSGHGPGTTRNPPTSSSSSSSMERSSGPPARGYRGRFSLRQFTSTHALAEHFVSCTRWRHHLPPAFAASVVAIQLLVRLAHWKRWWVPRLAHSGHLQISSAGIDLGWISGAAGLWPDLLAIS